MTGSLPGRGRSSIGARDTRLAGSVRDRERAVNLSISSSVIANSTARRHPAMMSLLVSPTAKRGIRHQTIGSIMQVSWNRSSRLVARTSEKFETKMSAKGLEERGTKLRDNLRKALGLWQVVEPADRYHLG